MGAVNRRSSFLLDFLLDPAPFQRPSSVHSSSFVTFLVFFLHFPCFFSILIMSKRPRSSSFAESTSRFLNQDKFRTLFSKRPVLIERQLVLSDFSLISPLFANLSWESITTLSGSVPIKLVQEIYSNFYETNFEECVFKTAVNRTHFTVTPDDIAVILGIDRPSPAERFSLFYPTQDGDYPSKQDLSDIFRTLQGSPPWQDETYVHGHLKTDHRMLNLFVSATIDPTSHYSDVTLRRGRIIYALVMGLKFDLALFIFRLMFTSQQLTRTKDSLPFGLLVSKLIESHSIELPTTGLVSQPSPITRLTARKSISQAVDDTADHPDVAESSRSTRPFTMNSMSLSLIRLEGEVESVREAQTHLGDRMTGIEASIQQLTQLCTINFQSLHQQIDNLGFAPDDGGDDPDDHNGFDGGDGPGGSGYGGAGNDGSY